MWKKYIRLNRHSFLFCKGYVMACTRYTYNYQQSVTYIYIIYIYNSQTSKATQKGHGNTELWNNNGFEFSWKIIWGRRAEMLNWNKLTNIITLTVCKCVTLIFLFPLWNAMKFTNFTFVNFVNTKRHILCKLCPNCITSLFLWSTTMKQNIVWLLTVQQKIFQLRHVGGLEMKKQIHQVQHVDSLTLQMKKHSRVVHC